MPETATVRWTELTLDVSAESRTLPREPESAAAARRLVQAALQSWGLETLVGSATLVVSELVANAAEHARGPSVQVTVTRVGVYRAQVAVTDLDRTVPVLGLAPGDDQERGRGLAIVAAVSEAWGVVPLSSGKRVWAQVAE
ncbi:ATP-binding protein [Streptomyces arboris]|uniref:ATP-binding protein n=1 Tax=Streptomyces arboris TaxID=2600619 RepID=UPI003BF57AFC